MSCEKEIGVSEKENENLACYIYHNLKVNIYPKSSTWWDKDKGGGGGGVRF